MKICTKCGSTGPFYKRAAARDGLTPECVECNKKAAASWEARNKEQRARTKKVWNGAHREELNEKRRRTGRAQKEADSARRRRERNKVKISAQNADWYNKNRERVRQNVQRWQRDHPECHRIESATRRTRKAQTGGGYTAQEWLDLCEQYGNQCLACGKTDVRLTADHVIPVVKGGTSNIDNIQPLCQSCNSKKHTRIIDYRITHKGTQPAGVGRNRNFNREMIR